MNRSFFTKSGRDFVEIVERILDRSPPHAAKAGVCAHLMGVALMKSQCAQGQFVIIHLDKKNAQRAVAAAQAQTGKPVERVEQK